MRSTLPIVKILDMGLARFTSETQCTVLTQTGQALGTIDYMSPEQAKDTKSAGIQADIFSLGASLFHMLTGKVPFLGKNPMEKLMARAMRDAPRASTLLPALPPVLDAIIARMLARNPADRFQTPDEVAAALSPFCLGAASDHSSSLTLRKPATTVSTIEAAADPLLGDFLASLKNEPVESPPSSMSGKALAAGEPEIDSDATAAWSDPSRSRLPGGTLSSGETLPASLARSRPAGGTYYALAVVVASLLVYFLWPRPATVTLDWPVNDRTGATLKIDGQAAPVANDREWRVSLAPGEHEVEIKRANYPPLKLELTAERGASQTLLVPSPLVSPYSSVEAKSAQSRWSQHLNIPVETKNTIGMTLFLIPPGEFTMGTPQTEVDRLKEQYKTDGWFLDRVGYEVPEHRVRITRPFLLGKYEVMQGEYEQVMGTNPSRFKEQGPRAPVEHVSWYEAVAFCNKLSEREKLSAYYRIEGNTVTMAGGAGYRLPREAEWEYACRAGTRTQWSCGDDPAGVREYGWFNETAVGKTHPVGEKRANGLGLCDMHGNVWEWCWDWHGKYDVAVVNDPLGAASGSDRMIRGGSWIDPAWRGRSAIRHWHGTASRYHHLGFRLALSSPVKQGQ